MLQRLWIFFLIFLFSLAFASFFPFNTTLLAVISISIIREPKEAMFWAFISGVVFDLITGGFLGVSSMVFLLIVLLLNLYKNKFMVSNLFYLLIFSYFSLFVFNFLTRRHEVAIFFVITPLIIIVVYPVFEILDNYFSRARQERLI